MFWKGLSREAAALEGINHRSRGLGFGLTPVGRNVSLRVFDLHLKLFDQPGAALGTRAKLFAPKLGDLEVEVSDHVV